MRNRWYFADIGTVLSKRPNAIAIIKGTQEGSAITGRVMFHQMRDGVLVRAEIVGLPIGDDACDSPIFAFHIHNDKNCRDATGENAKGHFNPDGCSHPYHAGDLPPLFGADGKAFSMFLTKRFKVKEVVGKTVIIHDGIDDFTTQPSGNAGEKIACGQIMPLMRAN